MGGTDPAQAAGWLVIGAVLLLVVLNRAFRDVNIAIGG